MKRATNKGNNDEKSRNVGHITNGNDDDANQWQPSPNHYQMHSVQLAMHPAVQLSVHPQKQIMQFTVSTNLGLYCALRPQPPGIRPTLAIASWQGASRIIGFLVARYVAA